MLVRPEKVLLETKFQNQTYTDMKHNDTNPRKCDRCPTAHWGVNGRYCQRLNRYVTHAATPPCEKVLQTKRA